MKWVIDYRLFKESKQDSYSSKNIIHELCISMVLLNNEFLDAILDKGLKARYSENSQIFLTDLKNLLISKNRLHLGKFVDNKCVSDDEISKVNGIFNSVEFNIEEDWNKLVNARITARSIMDKLFPDEKISSDMIRSIYWIGPNKTKDFGEDIVIEMHDGKQYSFFLNKNLSSQKTASFNTFADDLIGEDLDNLFKDEYISKWNKLIQQWIKILYENSNKNIQQHIEKFIDPKRIDTIGYFEYFEVRHRDPRYKHLGEFIKEFDKNILNFSDLMSEIWKRRDICFMDVERIYKEWMETKIFILNSKILEHLFTDSLKSSHIDDIKRLDDGFKLAGGSVKMKLIKTIVEKIGCLERDIYYVGNNGSLFHYIPSRDFFRKYYDDFSVKFDYHVRFNISDEEDNNDFSIKIQLDLDEKTLIDMSIIVKFSGGEMSGKLSSKYKFDLSDDFNYRISKKSIDSSSE